MTRTSTSNRTTGLTDSYVEQAVAHCQVKAALLCSLELLVQVHSLVGQLPLHTLIERRQALQDFGGKSQASTFSMKAFICDDGLCRSRTCWLKHASKLGQHSLPGLKLNPAVGLMMVS
jgi:hypothetical protein